MIAVAGTKHTPHNYFLKVQLLWILRKYGFYELFSELYLKIEVKAVLHECLGYLGQLPYFLNMEFDRFSVGFQKLEKFHNRCTSDLREVKNKALEERNFGAIEHFIDFERFNSHSYFRILCTFFQKCISFARAVQKHSKEQRIVNIEQLENFTLQTGTEMAKFFR